MSGWYPQRQGAQESGSVTDSGKKVINTYCKEKWFSPNKVMKSPANHGLGGGMASKINCENKINCVKQQVVE